MAITLGDPNGIGPEVVLKSLQDDTLRSRMQPVLVGSTAVLRHHAEMLGLDDLPIHTTGELPPDQEPPSSDSVPLLDVAEDYAPDVRFGEIHAEAGRLAMRAVEAATDGCATGTLDAMVTAPISKEAIARAGYEVPGHTEFIAGRLGRAEPLMLMVAGDLRIGLATVHVPLSRVPELLTTEIIGTRLRLIGESLRHDFGIEAPAVAVLGLNPHAGDGGTLGTEEQDVIRPAVEGARQAGLDAGGPFAADGFFGTRGQETYDAVLAMYHDQGLVPFKALTFGTGVNMTAGLPIVRTSPDHGTAFDIAGRGHANPGSMKHALELAVEVACRRTP